MSTPRVPPLAVAGGAALAQAVCARQSVATRSSLLSAAGIAAGAGWMMVGSFVQFRRESTTVDPVNVDRSESLVESGPNSISRNPMYLGMAGILVAHAVARRSMAGVVPAAVFVAVIDRCQIPVEEESLRRRFGVDYEDYARRVPRWVDRRSVDFRHAPTAVGATT